MYYIVYAICTALNVMFIGMVIHMSFLGKQWHLLNKLILTDATTTEEGYVSNVNRMELLGRIGQTLTPLRPAGTMLLDGERLDVVSEGNYINADQTVEIIKIEGSRIVVREQRIKEEV